MLKYGKCPDRRISKKDWYSDKSSQHSNLEEILSFFSATFRQFLSIFSSLFSIPQPCQFRAVKMLQPQFIMLRINTVTRYLLQHNILSTSQTIPDKSGFRQLLFQL